MKGRAASAVVLPVLSLAALGCGSGPDVTCGRTQPCAGDLVGSWTVDGGCSNGDVAASELMTIIGGPCPQLRIDTLVDNQSGTIAFDAATLTFTANLSITGTVTATIPTSCFDNMPCAALETFLAQEGLLVHNCAGTSACTCAIDRVPQMIAGAGTYTVGGSLLTLQPESAAIAMKQYCVAGSTMHLMGVNGETIVEDLVLTRVAR